jgi:hypothetical protein
MLESTMKKMIRNLFGGATAMLAAFALMPAAHALNMWTVDFNPEALTGLYFPGDSFYQSGFKMTVDPCCDFGTIDTAAALGPLAPTGNATPFYFNSNDGGLIFERESGLPFDLLGFSAAFVPLSPPSSQTTVIVAAGFDIDGNFQGVAFPFAAPVSGAYPFATYNDPLDFAGFVNMTSVEFFACSFDGVNLCAQATNNNGQFALDNVTGVPEPESLALVFLGMLALGLSRQRKLG